MRPLRSLILYILAVFVGGALLAPWLYSLVQAGAGESGFLHRLAANPFRRFVDRSFLVIALAGLWPLVRSLGITSWRDLGLVSPRGQGRRVLVGFLAGFLSLALVLGLALAFQARVWNADLTAGQLTGKLLGALGTAVVVAVLEEILFRGGIFGGLRRVMPWRLALLISSSIYAAVHFLERAEYAPPVTWLSGLQVLGLMFRGFADWHMLVPALFNLTLVGLLLGLAYQRTGNLYFSISLHAGWIFWLKSGGVLTGTASGANLRFWGSGKLIDGWLAGLVLLLGFLGVSFWRAGQPNRQSHESRS
ncbi:MAG TPA: CPBP family intramembrane glutamic endopeptidase [Dongiaceae bacterium]|nr:CPBP family intramembrane glutamic endopeptidase [Dongiaceae bacterium]